MQGDRDKTGMDGWMDGLLNTVCLAKFIDCPACISWIIYRDRAVTAVEFDISINFHKNEPLSRRTKGGRISGGSGQRVTTGVARGRGSVGWVSSSFEARDRNAEAFNLSGTRRTLLWKWLARALRARKSQTLILTAVMETNGSARKATLKIRILNETKLTRIDVCSDFEESMYLTLFICIFLIHSDIFLGR